MAFGAKWITTLKKERPLNNAGEKVRQMKKPFPGSPWRRVLKGNVGDRSYYFFKKGLMMSIGTGKMVVEFFSVAISAKV